jgi:hypothetical protein
MVIKPSITFLISRRYANEKLMDGYAVIQAQSTLFG